MAKIVKIEDKTLENVYELGTGTENFYCNGVLKHNCRCVTIVDKNGVKLFSRQG